MHFYNEHAESPKNNAVGLLQAVSDSFSNIPIKNFLKICNNLKLPGKSHSAEIA